MRTVPTCELVGDLEITVAILDEPPAAAPRVWHVIQMGVKHVYHVRDEDWPLRARRLRQLHARSAYMQRMTQAASTPTEFE
jgi:hypothetical protein